MAVPQDTVVGYRKAADEISEDLFCDNPSYGSYWRRLIVRNFNCADEELSIYTSFGTRRAITPCTMAAGRGAVSPISVYDANVLTIARRAGWTLGLVQNINLAAKIEDDESLAASLNEKEIAWDIQEHVQRLNWAIERLKHVEFFYGPGIRVVAPYEVGQSNDGRMLLRCYQTKGYSARGRPQGWKLFGLDRVSEIMVQCAPFTVRGDYFTLPPFWTKDLITWVA